MCFTQPSRNGTTYGDSSVRGRRAHGISTVDGEPQNGGYLRRPHHHHHQITCAFSGELARLHVAGERMGLSILENLSHDVNL